jgi:hypothetical protein
MSDLNQIITVSIDRNTTTPTATGFGQPLLAGYFSTSVFPERVKEYSTLAELVTEGFATTDPIYKMATDLLAQNPSPTTFKVGRLALPSTPTFTLTPSADSIVAGEAHALTITGPGATAGETFDLVAGFQGVLTVDTNPINANADTMTIGTTVYTFLDTPAAVNDIAISGVDAEGTVDNIIATINLTGTELTEYFTGQAIHPTVEAVKLSSTQILIRHKAGQTAAAVATTETFTAGTNVFGAATTEADTVGTILDWFDADMAANGTATVTFTDGATVGTVAAVTAGDKFGVVMVGEGWTVAETTADPGVATDLAAIDAYDNDWYALALDAPGTLEVVAAAAWIESNVKLFVAQTQETISASLASASDTSSLAYTLSNSNYDRTQLFFHKDNFDFVSAGMLGRILPEQAGSATWAYKQLNSIASQSLTTTEMANLEAKKANFLTTLAGVAVTRYGTASGAEYMDIMRGIDWLSARIQERVYALIINADKLPYTDSGIQAVRSEILAQLDQGIARGFIAASPAPTCTVPAAVDVSAADKGTRTLNDVTFRATLAGAIHKVAIEGELNL